MKTASNKLTEKNKKHKDGHWELFSMTLPGMLLVLIFSYLPMIGLIIAFKNYKYNKGIFGSKWCGLKNFEYLFKSNTFNIILRNTILYNFIFIILQIVAAIIVALALDNISKKSTIKIFQSSMFLPYFLSWIVVSYISHAFLEYHSGIINGMLNALSLNSISFYSEPKYWPFILAFFSIWKSIGFNALIYYGTILGIDQTLYEAATVEGCGYFRKVWHITFPFLKSTVIVLFLLALGGIFRSDYGMFLYLPKDTGALYNVTDVLDTYILRSLRTSGDVGAASAVGFLQSVVGFIMVITANKVVNKIDSDNALF